MNYLSTAEVCSKLGVSRAWVNTHFRHLGLKRSDIVDPFVPKTKTPQSVFFPQDALLEWLNDNAQFSRQTKYIDLSVYVEPDIINAHYKTLYALKESNLLKLEKKLAITDAQHEFRALYFPADLRQAVELIDDRKRGLLPWCSCNSHINSFSQLEALNKLQVSLGNKSSEMAYRYIYNRAMLKVEIDGRVWYMYDPTNINYRLLVPAGFQGA